MPGRFVFELREPSLWKQKAYLDAIHGTKKSLKPPPEVYATYGPEDLGQAMVIKVSHRPEWCIVLPTDPNRYPLECGFSYGVTSRTALWNYLKGVILAVCQACPGAFHFYYEDGDIGEGMKLVGYFDADTGSIITKHVGLPTSEQFEEAAMKGSEGQERQRRQQSQQTWDQRAALGLTGR